MKFWSAPENKIVIAGGKNIFIVPHHAQTHTQDYK